MPKRPETPSELKRARARGQSNRTDAEKDAGILRGVVKRNPHPRAGKRGTGAQPEYIIDREKLRELASTMCSTDEMSLILGVPTKFLVDHYFQEIREGQADAKMNLRKVQFQTAKGGNVVMQIWLGKQYLDQKDRSYNEQAGPDGKPIQVEKTTRVVAYIPDNGRDRPVDGAETDR